MIPAVIVCHGSLGEAYLQALEAIYGEVGDIVAVSNLGLSARDLEAAVGESVARLAQPCIVFTDYFGGSCALASQAEMVRRPDLRVLSGVNLPILLYYLAHRHELDIDALVQGILLRGQSSIRELSSPGL